MSFPDEISNIPHIYGYDRDGIDITTIFPSGEHKDITTNKTGSLLLVPEVDDPEFLAFDNPFQTPAGQITVLTDEVSIDLANPGVGEVYINRSNGDFKFNEMETITSVYFFYTGYGSVVKADTYYNPVGEGLVETQECVLDLMSGVDEHVADTNNPHQVTATQIGAVTEDHTHDDRYYTEDEVDILLSNKENVLSSGDANQYLNGNKEFVSITPSSIGAAEESHTHVFEDLTVTRDITDGSNSITVEQMSDLFNTEIGISQIISGGEVVWASGLIFDINAAVYYINSVRYTSDVQQITLDTADPLYDRIDVIALDINGDVVKITGVPSEEPQKPSINPESQIECTFISVTAGGTVPAIEQTNIYIDNNEWTTNITGNNIVANSTTNPYSGTYCIEVSNAEDGDAISFTSLEPIDVLDKAHVLSLQIRSKTEWDGGSLQIGFFYNGSLVGKYVPIRHGLFRFDSSIVDAYQQIVIPIYFFELFGSIDEIRIQCYGESIGFYIDNIVLQRGIPTSTPQKTWSTITSDNGRVLARFANDTLFVYGGSNIETSVIDDKVVIAATGLSETDHTHDDRYYTQEQIDLLIPSGGWQPVGDYITEQVLLLTSGDLQDQIDNKSDSDHTHSHGNLTDLSNDDHEQYILVDGTRAFSDSVSGVNPTEDAHLATKWYVDFISGEVNETLLLHIEDDDNPHGVTYQQVGASPSGHDHDDVYYTESEIDGFLSGYQLAGDYITESVFTSTSGNLQDQIDLKPNIDDFIDKIPLCIYISPSGDDITGNGSIAAPWATLDKALKYLKSQDDHGVINLSPGAFTYIASNWDQYPSSKHVVLQGSDCNLTTINLDDSVSEIIEENDRVYSYLYVSVINNLTLNHTAFPEAYNNASFYILPLIDKISIFRCKIDLEELIDQEADHRFAIGTVDSQSDNILYNCSITRTNAYGSIYINANMLNGTVIANLATACYIYAINGVIDNLFLDSAKTLLQAGRLSNSRLYGKTCAYHCGIVENNWFEQCEYITFSYTSDIIRCVGNYILASGVDDNSCGSLIFVQNATNIADVIIANNYIRYTGKFGEAVDDGIVSAIMVYNSIPKTLICNNVIDSPTMSAMIGHGFQDIWDPNFQTLDRNIEITNNTFINKFAAETGPLDNHACVHIHSRGEFLISDNRFIQDSSAALNADYNDGMALRLVRPNEGTAKAVITGNYFETKHPASGDYRSTLFCSVASGVGGEWDITLSNNIFNALSEQDYTIAGDASVKFLGQNTSPSGITCQVTPVWDGSITSSVIIPDTGFLVFNDNDKWQIGLSENNLNLNYSGDTIASFKPTDVDISGNLNLTGSLYLNTLSPKNYATCHIKQNTPIVVLETLQGEAYFCGYLAQSGDETILAAEDILSFKSGVSAASGPVASGISLATWTTAALAITTPVQISGVQECLQITATALATNKTAMKLSPTIASANVNAAAGLDITLSNAQNDTDNCSSRAAYFKYLHTGTFTRSSRLCQVNAMRADASHGGATSGTNANKSVYGVIGTASNTGAVTSGTSVRYTYGGYFSATGSSDGTSYAYGVYATATGANVNAAFLGGGTQAFMSVNDGAAATPSFTFYNESNTGMYRAASSVLAFSVGGTERLRITTSGIKATGYTASNGSPGVDGTVTYHDVYDEVDYQLSFKDGLLISKSEFSP